jgi:hypothetical protein
VNGKERLIRREGGGSPFLDLSTRLIYTPIPAKILDIVMLFPFYLG